MNMQRQSILSLQDALIFIRRRPRLLNNHRNHLQQPWRTLSRFSSSSSTTTRMRIAISKLTTHLPPSLQKHATPLQNAPISHAISFLILHELTAVIPLFGLVGVFEYTGWIPSILGEEETRRGKGTDGEDVAVNDDGCQGDGSRTDVQMFETWLEKKGWIRDELVEEEEEEEEGQQWDGRRDGEKEMNRTTAFTTKGKATGYVPRLVLEFATAYAITKLLLPVRVVVSVWATPWFARSMVVPVRDMLSRMARVMKKSGKGQK